MGILSPSGVEQRLLHKVQKLIGGALAQPNRRGGAITYEDFVNFLDEEDSTSKKVFEVLLLETCLRKRRDSPSQSTRSTSASSSTSTVRPTASSSRHADRWPSLPQTLLQAVNTPPSDSSDSETDRFADLSRDINRFVNRSNNATHTLTDGEDQVNFEEMFQARMRDTLQPRPARTSRVRTRDERNGAEAGRSITLEEMMATHPSRVGLPSTAAAGNPWRESAWMPNDYTFLPEPTFFDVWNATVPGEPFTSCETLSELVARLNQRLGAEVEYIDPVGTRSIYQLVDLLDVRVPGVEGRVRDAVTASRRSERNARRLEDAVDDMGADVSDTTRFREDLMGIDTDDEEGDEALMFDFVDEAPSAIERTGRLFEQFSRRRRSMAGYGWSGRPSSTAEREAMADPHREGMDQLEMRRATRELDQIRDRLVREDAYDTRYAARSEAGADDDSTSGVSTPLSLFSTATIQTHTTSSAPSPASASGCPTPPTRPQTSASIAEEAARQRRAIRPLPTRPTPVINNAGSGATSDSSAREVLRESVRNRLRDRRNELREGNGTAW